LKQAPDQKRNYPRSFCQFEFTQACDLVDLQIGIFALEIDDFGLFHSESLALMHFVWLITTLPSFKISAVKNME